MQNESCFAKMARAVEIKTQFMDRRQPKPDDHECMTHDRDISRDQASETNAEARDDSH